LAPVYRGERQAARQSRRGFLLVDRDAINLYQPGLGSEVVGGWWYPEDAQVDNRALVRALWTAAQSLGVDVRDRITVEAIQQQRMVGVQTSVGNPRRTLCLAAGAWMNVCRYRCVRANAIGASA